MEGRKAREKIALGCASGVCRWYNVLHVFHLHEIVQSPYYSHESSKRLKLQSNLLLCVRVDIPLTTQLALFGAVLLLLCLSVTHWLSTHTQPVIKFVLKFDIEQRWCVHYLECTQHSCLPVKRLSRLSVDHEPPHVIHWWVQQLLHHHPALGLWADC